MDMNKILAYVQNMEESLEGLRQVIEERSLEEGAVYVDQEQNVIFVSTQDAVKILDSFGNNSESVRIGKTEYILLYDAGSKLNFDGESYIPSGYLVMKSCNGLQPVDEEDVERIVVELRNRTMTLALGRYRIQAYQVGEEERMNNKPWAYVTAAWSTDRSRAKRSAKRYCRKLYEAGYTPICPLLSLPEIINVSNADEFKDYIDMSEDMLRRSRILVVCGTAVDETVLTDIAIANRFHVASSTMRGVLTVDKSKKFE